MKMGNLLPGHTNCDDTDSDEELDDSLLLNRGVHRSIPSRNQDGQDVRNMRTDAVGHRRVIKTHVFNEPFDEILKQWDAELDFDEQISLIFLLYPSPQNLIEIDNILKNGSLKTVLSNWYVWKGSTPVARKTIVEALCIIQNYDLLVRQGYNKSDLISEFLPLQRRIATNVDNLRKAIYRMFEDMGTKTEKLFLQLINNDFQSKQLEFRTYTHLEIYYAYFESIGYVTPGNIDNLLKHLKVLELDSLIDDLKEIVQRSNQNTVTPSTSRLELRGPSMNIDKASPSQLENVSSVKTMVKSTNTLENYKMDPKSPGVILIIENENFYTEPAPTKEHKPIKQDRKIENRKGSRKDSDRLRRLFDRLGFKVEYHRDKIHSEMETIIKHTAHKLVTEDHSSFILCLLSHGLEGQVIACNSVPLYIAKIKKWITSPQLEGKPKVLILQFCQGEEIQKLGSTSSIDQQADAICTDGPGHERVAKTADVLELWSTVPGFASFRSMDQGTWFIQILCEILENESNELHLFDVCLVLENRIRGKRWIYPVSDNEVEERVMVTQLVSTFNKRFYFPPLKN